MTKGSLSYVPQFFMEKKNLNLVPFDFAFLLSALDIEARAKGRVGNND